MTDKLELKSCHEVVYTVDVADVDSIFYCKPTDPDILTVLMKDGKRLYCDEVCPIDSLQEEPVSKDLEEASEQLAENARKHKAETSSPFFSQTDYKQGVIDGAKWQKENLWKPADGDELPEIDREVIVLCKNGRVVFGHRPFEKFIARPIGYGRTKEYEVKTYDKGGWNIPNIKYWLDVELPKEIEL